MGWKDKLSSPVLEKLQIFARLIHHWNPRINLTGYKSLTDIEELLIGDSVDGLLALAPNHGTVLDFGSGAGIPGLVWALCNPGLQITSLEIREKKIAFQKEAQRQLEIPARVLRGHFPEAVMGEHFDIIVSRAIRLEPAAWHDAEKYLAPGGRLVRFMPRDTVEGGWKTVVASDRTALLIRG